MDVSHINDHHMRLINTTYSYFKTVRHLGFMQIESAHSDFLPINSNKQFVITLNQLGQRFRIGSKTIGYINFTIVNQRLALYFEYNDYLKKVLNIENKEIPIKQSHKKAFYLSVEHILNEMSDELHMVMNKMRYHAQNEHSMDYKKQSKYISDTNDLNNTEKIGSEIGFS